MTEKNNSSMQKTGSVFPIRTVSELTGVNAITLRAWESRYGLIEPIRKESGHRLYSQQHIDLINRVVGLLDRGIRIGQVKAYLAEEMQQQEAQEASGPGADTWQRLQDGMVAAVIRFDETALDQVYSEALSMHSINTVTRRLITPLLIELGRRWESGMGSVAEEHFFGFYLRNKLGARFHHRVKNQTGPLLLMACLPGERHEVGMLLVALAANEAGYRPLILGADLPLEELPAVALKTGCDAVVLSGFVRPSDEILKKHLPALVNNSPVPVLMGGPVSVMAFDALRGMGIEPLGTDVDSGLKRLHSILSKPNRH